ncbi:hypothetical protein EPUS_08753 [Endocarpon pusillum Z07020]|uniref:non-specific serine/threonine protein kinase n=1 Tax=Endocarpon pusillum (strain Z07020 / HMAS-L-300199) TaxID=1263415 RepID=U1GNN6_ENDPU|nr:uncharacterized protein EPUS_08753 [Endocarpon pusillum Z07020]ERF73546.1 hypothetical protein EPUS_08753 [Endocarpon pusillum Z07020]
MNPPITLDLDNFRSREESWRLPVSDALEDPFFYRAAHYWGQDETLFLNSATDLDDDTGWKPVRPLGKGGYGIVGLWQQTDNNGIVLDSLAIKQQRYRDHTLSQAQLTADSGIAYEAGLMYQLNEQECPNIIKLRGFKDHPLERLWRFYLEYAEWGDLRRLETYYRAWNTYLPEEFLWQVFHDLANAALALAAGDFHKIGEASGPETDSYVVHFDLKPENIVLGDPPDPNPVHFSNYPVAKMADFGLARSTNHLDRSNPAYYRGLGTPGYLPPEQEGQTAHWKNRPYGKDRRRQAPPNLNARRRRSWCIQMEMRDPTPGYHFDPTHNTHCIGKIMFELLTLRGSDRTRSEIEALTEKQYWNEFELHGIEEIRTTRQPEYSYELRNLVRSCLKTAPATRPTHGQLWQTTFDELESRVKAVEDPATGLKNGPRVFYMGNEINDMPIGQQDLPSDQDIPFTKKSFYANREIKYQDPELEPLLGGRWDPQLQRHHGEIPSPIRGGRKRRWEPEAYIFMPRREDSQRVAKMVRSAQGFYDEEDDMYDSEGDDRDGDEDDEDDDGDDGDDRGDSGHVDQGERQGPPRGGGKTRGQSRGGSGGRAGIQGMGRGGRTMRGKGRSRETGGEEGDRTSRSGRSGRSDKKGAAVFEDEVEAEEVNGAGEDKEEAEKEEPAVPAAKFNGVQISSSCNKPFPRWKHMRCVEEL